MTVVVNATCQRQTSAMPSSKRAQCARRRAAIAARWRSQPARWRRTSGLEEIIVTAQKRDEKNLQNVPISIQAFGTQKLEELNIQKFNDYVKFLPSVTHARPSAPASRSSTCAASRAAATATTRGSQPSVGMYLDEQPITTIQGALDVHLYDIARVEALAGPQGTLYGASSQAGTIRIITNKPDPSGFDGGLRPGGQHGRRRQTPVTSPKAA